MVSPQIKQVTIARGGMHPPYSTGVAQEDGEEDDGGTSVASLEEEEEYWMGAMLPPPPSLNVSVSGADMDTLRLLAAAYKVCPTPTPEQSESGI